MLRNKHVLALLAMLLVPAVPAAAAPNVVASIKPVHSLVAAIMQGVGTPHLIVAGSGSPHTYAMKPSDADAIQNADLVFWIGPDLELFLANPLQNLTTPDRTVALSGTPGLTTLPVRAGGIFDEAGHAEHDAVTDPHIWLDPENAKRMTARIAGALEAADPAHAERYAANATRAANALDTLMAETRASLAPVRDLPFVVFHDAFGYFENRFALSAAGSIVVEPDIVPGVRRIAAIHARLKAFGAACVFSEPEFQSSLVETVTEGTATRTGVLDPLGADLADGPGLYFELIRALTKNLKACLIG